MRAAGLDIGSRSTELVVVDNASREALEWHEIETTHQVEADCRRLLAQISFDRLIVTGYGRTLAEVVLDCRTVTEIKAYARGAQALYPACRGVLDIGGQDTKAIVLDGNGRPLRFEMNDRCAAGAGRFLEMMAAALHYRIDEFGSAGQTGQDGVQISSMCAVFSESEVIGLMTRGVKREDIARAVHRTIIGRSLGMLTRIDASPPLMFAGGAARNPCLVSLLSEAMPDRVFVPEHPQMVGALGAALLACES